MTRNDLSVSTARSKDGEAFASELVCEQKGRGHLGFGRRGRQIDGFRDSAVAISLKHRVVVIATGGRPWSSS